MDLHVPEGPIRSVKDFLIHIVIVTIGILIALGLEQLVEAHHRAHLAHEAVEGFRHELTSDSADVTEVLASNPGVRKKIGDWIADLSLAAPHEMDAYPGVHFNIMPTASWDTAMVTQALSEIPYERAHRYAIAYDLLHTFVDVQRRGLSDWQDLHVFGHDPVAMTPEQRHILIERLRRYETDLDVIESAGKNFLEASQAALGDQPHA
ncbi:MAG TPA: hypothetical protein VKP60_21975 [Magnetospirillaceae bacterium]|nr:hypothetical protein [Magnetospirillaceae bacterium]